MEKDLKAQNVLPLTAIYIGTLFIVAIVQRDAEEVFALSLKFDQESLVVSAMTSFGAILSNFLPNKLKYLLVYFRFRNALSGYRCRRICVKDPRFSLDDLEQKWPMLFLLKMSASEQNAYWYKEIYQPARNAPEVVQAHRKFLLFRDAASGLFVLLLCLLLWQMLTALMPLPSLRIWSVVVPVIIVLFLCQAARQSGDRMVANAVVVGLRG